MRLLVFLFLIFVVVFSSARSDVLVDDAEDAVLTFNLGFAYHDVNNKSNVTHAFNVFVGTEPQIKSNDTVLLDSMRFGVPPFFSGNISSFNLSDYVGEISWEYAFPVFNSSFGNISFLSFVDWTNSSVVNLSWVNVSFNNASVQSDFLSMLNISSRISLRGVTVVWPKILVDNGTCEACVLEFYEGQLATFLVPWFSWYSVAENSSYGVNVTFFDRVNYQPNSVGFWVNVTRDGLSYDAHNVSVRFVRYDGSEFGFLQYVNGSVDNITLSSSGGYNGSWITSGLFLENQSANLFNAFVFVRNVWGGLLVDNVSVDFFLHPSSDNPNLVPGPGVGPGVPFVPMVPAGLVEVVSKPLEFVGRAGVGALLVVFGILLFFFWGLCFILRWIWSLFFFDEDREREKEIKRRGGWR